MICVGQTVPEVFVRASWYSFRGFYMFNMPLDGIALSVILAGRPIFSSGARKEFLIALPFGSYPEVWIKPSNHIFRTRGGNLGYNMLTGIMVSIPITVE